MVVASPIIGGGGGAHIRVLQNKCLLKSIVFMVCEPKYMNVRPPSNGHGLRFLLKFQREMDRQLSGVLRFHQVQFRFITFQVDLMVQCP